MVFSFLASLFALIIAGYLVRFVLRQERGTPKMLRIADAVSSVRPWRR
jgi:hypothetical protein